MANSLENFKPVGGVQVRAHELSGPQLPGVNIGRPQGQYIQPILTQQQHIVQQPIQQGPMFGGGGPQNMPKGAQPVPLAGSVPAALGNTAPRLPMSPQAALQGPKAPSDGEIHLIKVEGQGTDGRRYIAEFEAVFPRGTKVLGVTEVEPG